jgi:hypothetical protein
MNTVNYIGFFDWLLAMLYILIIIVVVVNIQKRNIKKFNYYKYFLLGMIAKIIGAIVFCNIYVYYYKNGDTLGYHDDANAMINLLIKSPADFLRILMNIGSFQEQYSCFDYETGFPGYLNVRENAAMNTVRFVIPIELLGMRSYLVSSIVMAVISFSGIWKLYSVFCECYPELYRQFAVAILFIPSVLFWGSGILKDSLTLAAAGWYFYSFYKIFIVKNKSYSHILTLIISISIIIAIKPYVFVGLLPGSLIWGIWSRLISIKSIFLRFLVTPLVIGLGFSLGFLMWSATNANLGEYGSLDSMVSKAYISYVDLKSEHYHGNSFDLGEYDPTLSGLLSRFPIATMTGLFRPYLWEAKNPVMIISGLENFLFLFYIIYFLLRRPVAFIGSLFTNPLVLFSIIFGVSFAFSVAISTSNFGAMVRLRIPAIPFFLSGIILATNLKKDDYKFISKEIN